MDAQIPYVRRIRHQSHSRDRHHQGSHHGHARGNGRSCTAAPSTSDFFRDALDRDTDTTLNALLKPPVDIERFSRMMQTDLRDDNSVGAAIQRLLLSGRHRDIDS